MLRTVIAASTQPGGKSLGSHLAASAVEQHDNCRSSTLLASEPFEKSLLGAKCLGPASGERRASVEIDLYERVKAVFRRWPGTDVGQCQLHGEEHILWSGLSTRRRDFAFVRAQMTDFPHFEYRPLAIQFFVCTG
jgi:hypothetical protein